MLLSTELSILTVLEGVAVVATRDWAAKSIFAIIPLSVKSRDSIAGTPLIVKRIVSPFRPCTVKVN